MIKFSFAKLQKPDLAVIVATNFKLLYIRNKPNAANLAPLICRLQNHGGPYLKTAMQQARGSARLANFFLSVFCSVK